MPESQIISSIDKFGKEGTKQNYKNKDLKTGTLLVIYVCVTAGLVFSSMELMDHSAVFDCVDGQCM